MADKKRIDVHHHVLPQFFREPQTAVGRTGTAFGAFPDWTPDKSIALMDDLDIETAILSFSAPGIYFGNVVQTQDLARQCNDYLAELIDKYPGRFGGFACLPLPSIDASVEELARAIDVLKLDGVVQLTATDNRYLGHPDFRPIYDELNRRKCITFIHPTIPPKSAQRGWNIPSAIVEYPLETTKAVGNLLFEGVLADYPDIPFIVSHAGGAIPMIAHRLAIFDSLTAFIERYPEGALQYLKRLYYDTGLSGDAMSLTALQQLADPSRILFGTDYPYVHEGIIAAEVAGTEAFDGFDAAQHAAIDRGNAVKLFPRFGG